MEMEHPCFVHCTNKFTHIITVCEGSALTYVQVFIACCTHALTYLRSTMMKSSSVLTYREAENIPQQHLTPSPGRPHMTREAPPSSILVATRYIPLAPAPSGQSAHHAH